MKTYTYQQQTERNYKLTDPIAFQALSVDEALEHAWQEFSKVPNGVQIYLWQGASGLWIRCIDDAEWKDYSKAARRKNKPNDNTHKTT